MQNYHVEELLVLTKTYPVPSRKYRETSCVAAINRNGDLRRLYPIPYRLLDGEHQFKRWEWIRARICRPNNDHRPESYRIDVDSIERLSRVGTEAAWAERYQWIKLHQYNNFNALENRRQYDGITLGFIKPTRFSLIIEKARYPEWTDEEKVKLIQDGLFDSPEVISRVPLKKVPFDFYYQYECQTEGGVDQHRHKITDWEVGALFWNCITKYDGQWESYFRKKLEKEFAEKDLMFLMGTIHRFPDKWLIVGLFYPPKVKGRQMSMWVPFPNG